MIVTVTLNPAVDKTYRVEDFRIDRIHRPTEWSVEAGGKGINVARVYHTLGGEAVATGFLGGTNGRLIARSLRKEQIEARFVTTRDESRVCMAIVDPRSSTQTEINEPGPVVRPTELRHLAETLDDLLATRAPRFVCLSGSIARGCPTAIYADLARAVAARGASCVLDASGEALRAGVAARPWMLKPNRFELQDLVGRPLDGAAQFGQAALELVRSGIEIVAVTLGARGCLLAAGTDLWYAVPPAVPFVSAVGSGDSFVGAFLYELDRGSAPPEALRMAVGAGAANAAVYGCGFCSAESIREIAARVTVERMR